ncbi:helix-turn-helix transcriptional regulator [Parahaliea mediterranea]|uniref:Helix-turn-helix transcriptional regulator n=1 Tax=Parahaliea mediterranea TaxID=651086 RepID=A0A939ILE7_9GAMM|nr:helix-turn-helix transcriptional regulator [Parahaliea mediterranea]
MRDAFLGRTRFEQFRRHIGISKATLTRRLDALINEGVLYKQPGSASSTRFEYRLTEKGAGLFSSSLLAWQWELDWCAAERDGAKSRLPYELFHRRCGQELYPLAVCRHCRRPVQVDDVELPEQALSPQSQLDEIRSLNRLRRVRSATKSGTEDLMLANISDLIGDRWTLLLLISAFFGLRRYDQFLKQLSIASNILTARLNFLVDVEVFERRTYQENPPRSDYLLSAKGKSLFPIVMAMRQWVIDDLDASHSATELIHTACGKNLEIDVQCEKCCEIPARADVQFIEADTP